LVASNVLGLDAVLALTLDEPLYPLEVFFVKLREATRVTLRGLDHKPLVGFLSAGLQYGFSAREPHSNI
jgi:hypothetical protein